MNETSTVYQQTVNALPHPLAVLNGRGVIIMVNEAWKSYSQETCISELRFPEVGNNYIEYCRGISDSRLNRIQEGLQQVLSGKSDSFEMEYPLICNAMENWFHVQICPIEVGAEKGLLVIHLREPGGGSAEAVLLREEEFRSLSSFAQTSSTQVTAQTFGIVPLSAGFPQAFAGFTDAYESLLELMLEENIFRVDHQRSSRLREMASQLGFLKAGPRDVIEIHSSALKNKVQSVSYQKAQAYIAEGRILVLELMGYLTGYYRSRAVNVFQAGSRLPENGEDA